MKLIALSRKERMKNKIQKWTNEWTRNNGEFIERIKWQTSHDRMNRTKLIIFLSSQQRMNKSSKGNTNKTKSKRKPNEGSEKKCSFESIRHSRTIESNQITFIMFLRRWKWETYQCFLDLYFACSKSGKNVLLFKFSLFLFDELQSRHFRFSTNRWAWEIREEKFCHSQEQLSADTRENPNQRDYSFRFVCLCTCTHHQLSTRQDHLSAALDRLWVLEHFAPCGNVTAQSAASNLILHFIRFDRRQFSFATNDESNEIALKMCSGLGLRAIKMCSLIAFWSRALAHQQFIVFNGTNEDERH